MTRLWLFNMDAEDELAALRAGLPWPSGPSGPAARARDAAAARLGSPVTAGGWLAPRDAVLALGRGASAVERDEGAGEAGALGVPWCPTPSAVARLAASGACVADRVAADILARANARETFAALDALPQSCICHDLSDVRGAVGRAPAARSPGKERAPAWLLRRSLCAAGRGRLVTERWSERATAWTRSALLLGPVHVAPLVDVSAEFALHGRVACDGVVRIGRPVVQRAVGGAFRSASVAEAGALSTDEQVALISAAEEVGRRLAEMSYEGPFGIDALRWVDGLGRTRFNAPSEVNARFTMSFPIGAPELMPN